MSITRITVAERRRGWDPDETCTYCGDTRQNHERVTRAWEFCTKQARLLAKVSVPTQSAS